MPPTAWPFALALAATLAADRRPQVGDLLVAARRMQDPNFDHTVVLLIRAGEDGAAGVIVNRPLDLNAHELLPDVAGLARYREPVYEGGPVATDAFAVLVTGDEPEEGTRRVLDGVHLGASREILERLASSKKSRKTFRLYVGHAGWAPGQLEGEIAAGGWHVLAGDAAAVFADDPSGLWKRLVPESAAAWVGLRPARDAGRPVSLVYQRSSPPR